MSNWTIRELYLTTLILVMLFVLCLKSCTVLTYDNCVPYSATVEQIKECEKVLK